MVSHLLLLLDKAHSWLHSGVLGVAFHLNTPGSKPSHCDCYMFEVCDVFHLFIVTAQGMEHSTEETTLPFSVNTALSGQFGCHGD